MSETGQQGPACEGCGCTEERACPGGCAWDVSWLVVGRYICSTCAPDFESPGDYDDEGSDDE